MKAYVEARPKVTTPEQVVNTLAQVVRSQLYRPEQQRYFHGQLKDLRRATRSPGGRKKPTAVQTAVQPTLF